MRHLLIILATLFICAAPAQAQTLKSLMYNTTNGQVIAATNVTFTNTVRASSAIRVGSSLDIEINGSGIAGYNSFVSLEEGFLYFNDGEGDWDLSGSGLNNSGEISFNSTNASAATRTNLGLGATWLTNTNVENFRTAIGLGETNQVTFQEVYADTIVATTSINNSGNFTNNGDITINQTATNNGLLYIRRTNNESFLGLANLIASNNTTISNETLFRVGVSEATNKAAQFGFRSTNTNGNGVAVFSVFGFNALMMVGADASTNAVIYSGGGTNNEVMTLIRDGATEFARPLRFSTNASTRPSTNAPANTNAPSPDAWIEMRIGTNSYRVPLYQ